jgi:ATP-binding cassette subfamily B protein
LIEAGEITEGVVLSFIFYINMLTWPMASLGWVTSLIQRAEASQARINNFLEEQESLFVDGEESIESIDKIEFKNVNYQFPNSSTATLKNLNFSIPKGSKTGIVGRTGTGKSTIVNLIFRHLDPSSGHVLVNGIPLPQLQIKSYRKMIGAVPQEVFLFSDTIGNNIRFGLPEDTPDEAILDAAKFAHVHHNIEEFEDQYDTILGERGINLSGGQKQRISLARAVIKKPDLLIFDDSLSAVDTETEEVILNNIKTKLASVTTLIVAHRLSSVVDCDQILVLENGQIAESGRHEELLNLKGIYAEMYEKQLVEE